MANKQDKITLVVVEFQWHDLTKYAIEQTLKHITPKEIVVISDKEIMPGARHIQRAPVANIAEYAQILLKEMGQCINTSHALYMQWDGMAVDKNSWSDDFLNYDYIGAPWPWKQEGVNVGNGGFSLRSKKLLDACMDEKIQATSTNWAEDTIIGDTYRSWLTGYYGIKYAPTELAKQFSFEIGKHGPSFGFHGVWNVFNLMSDNDMDYYVSRIDYNGWNEHKWHHVLRAIQRRHRLDLFELVVEKLSIHNPELLDIVGARFTQSADQANGGLVIN